MTLVCRKCGRFFDSLGGERECALCRNVPVPFPDPVPSL